MISSGVEIFVELAPIDLRWGSDRLSGIVEQELRRVARSGALLVFFGKRRGTVNVVFFDGSGMCLFYLLVAERAAADRDREAATARLDARIAMLEKERDHLRSSHAQLSVR
jgi:transposase